MKTKMGDVRIVVLETENLKKLQEGKPIKTYDGSVLIAWTPDPVWLADKIMDSGGDPAEIGRLIDESSKRPQKPSSRKYHEPRIQKLGD